MSNKINTEELKTIIANQIKLIGLNDVLDAAAIEKIQGRIMNVYNHEQAKNQIPEVIPEAVFPSVETQNDIPNEVNSTGTTDSFSVEADMNNGDSTQQPGQNIDRGTSGNIPGYVPELPLFMEKIEPAKVIVFSQNELSESGENLSNKPLRTFEDPDVKKSMNEFWLDKGQKKADVYMVKFEKIGELDFNYANGSTQFIEKRFEPDFEAQAKYKENPYMAGTEIATPGLLNISGQPNTVAQIATAVDLEKAVKDVVMNILRDQLLTNTEKATSPTNLPKTEEGVPIHPRGLVLPGQNINESLSLKMIDLVNEYNKVDTPPQLKEAIDKNDKNYLLKENSEVQEWIFNGKSYYTPIVKISTKKCYIK